MQESKLYRYLSRLDTAERNVFVRYVEALGGKNREELGRMAKLFVQQVVQGKGMTREAFYNAMNWDLPFNPGLLAHRLTDLKKRLDTFLAIQALQRDAGALTVWQLRAVSSRGWADFLNAESKSAQETMEDAPADSDRFLHLMQAEEVMLSMTMESARKFKEPSFQLPMQHLEDFFCLQQLRYACAALTQDRVMNIAHDYGMTPAVLLRLQKRAGDLPPILQLYLHAHQMLVQPDEKAHFLALQAGLEKHWQTLNGEIARELYKYLLNHCADRINAGELAFQDEVVRIYAATLESEALLTDGRIDPGQLKNMISMLIRLGKLPLAEQFLETYGPKLTPDAEPVTIDFIRAVLLYHQAQYSTARKLLEVVLRDAQDLYFKVEARFYSWRCSYELGDLDLSEDNYNSLRMYLQRDKLLSAAIRKSYLQFATYLHRLWQICHETMEPHKRKKKLLTLQAQLAVAKDVANIVWLREKVGELIKSL